jgi:hypothetical protein
MSSGYTIVNTASTIYSGFTFTNYLGNQHTIFLPPNVTYYIAGLGVTSPSVDLVLTNLGTLDGYLNLQSCCDGTDISVAVVTGSTLSPSGVFTNMGYVGRANGVDYLYGCFKTQSISSTPNFTEYPVFASGSTYIDCNDCIANNQCDIEECCILLHVENFELNYYRSLFTESIINGRQYYIFDNFQGETIILYWDLFLQTWILNNLTTPETFDLGSYGFTTGYCPTNTTLLIDDTILTNGFSAYVTTTSFVCSGCSPTYCITDTGLGYDDNFVSAGTYNGDTYWSGITNGDFIYFTTGGTWCLSTTLGGFCLLEGPYPCNSSCPDLCDDYVFSGACPTPTPTPTVNCSVLDFSAIFDCEVTPTPSVTPTISTTPTMTPTPTPSDPCGGRALDATITGYTPTPTATLTPTPTLTPEVTRPCAISGTVTYNTINSTLVFPMSKQFQDCFNGVMYYTTSEVPLPSGGTIAVNNIFKADVNGVSRCISFVGMNLSIMGIDIIELFSGPLASCIVCTPDVTQTPTPTPTPSFTPTNTPTPTPSVMNGYYVYKQCGIEKYIVQSIPGPTLNVGEVFINPSSLNFNNCWEYIGFYLFEPTLPLGSLITNYSGNLFPDYGFNYFNSCSECSPTIQ